MYECLNFECCQLQNIRLCSKYLVIRHPQWQTHLILRLRLDNWNSWQIIFSKDIYLSVEHNTFVLTIYLLIYRYEWYFKCHEWYCKNLLSNDLILIVKCLHQLTPCLRIVVKCKHRFTLSHTSIKVTMVSILLSYIMKRVLTHVIPAWSTKWGSSY